MIDHGRIVEMEVFGVLAKVLSMIGRHRLKISKVGNSIWDKGLECTIEPLCAATVIYINVLFNFKQIQQLLQLQYKEPSNQQRAFKSTPQYPTQLAASSNFNYFTDGRFYFCV